MRALMMAEKNLDRLNENSKVELSLGDWWEPLEPWWGSFDLVLSNPPYIPESVLKELEPIVRDHEPHLALSGGHDGMDSIRKIVGGAMTALSPGGWLIFEHHHDQSERSLDYLVQSGFINVTFEKDLDGIRRFAIGRHP